VLVEGAMFAFLAKLLLVVRSRLKSRARLEAENLVLGLVGGEEGALFSLCRSGRSRDRGG
jgi:hypothetical protein